MEASSAAPAPESAPAQQPPALPHGLPLNFMSSAPDAIEGQRVSSPSANAAAAAVIGLQQQAIPQQMRPTASSALTLPPAGASQPGTSNATNTTPSSNPRLRSSIACARCRRSKIKCTNAGAGTTCEACAHSNRECVYPAPGTTGSGAGKRSSDVHGEDGAERTKRSRARKTDALSGLEYALRDARGSPLRAQVAPMGGTDPHLSPAFIRDAIWRSPVLNDQVLAKVFDLFQLHYETELPFLHTPTFQPKLLAATAAYGANPAERSLQIAVSPDTLATQLVGLGLLTLTARFHGDLQEFYWSTIARDVNVAHRDPSAVSDYYASALRNIITEEAVLSDQQPTLEKVQGLLMLTLYDWSLSRGVQAWMYLGLALRMAQSMGLFYEDMDPAELWPMGFAAETASFGIKVADRSFARSDAGEVSSSDLFVEEESRRRTAWSCFILDRYLSNGSFRPGVLNAEKLIVQLPCGEKAWAFGERVCTPFLSHQNTFNDQKFAEQRGERFAKKTRFWQKIRERQQVTIGNESTDVETRNLKRALQDNEESKVAFESGEAEGLLSRFVKITDIWGKVARKVYSAATTKSPVGSKGAIIAAHEIDAALRKFKESSPRSFRHSDSNVRAHAAQHTLPPFCLVNAIYSISQMVFYRESLPFLPMTIDSPVELDETDHGMDTPLGRARHAASVQKYFSATHDFLSLFEACSSQRLQPSTPMMGLGLFLASFAGIYACNLPHMDADGAVCGSDQNPRTILESQKVVLSALKTIAEMRLLLPIAQNWFRTLHRLHCYYRKAARDYRTNPQAFSRPQHAIKRTVAPRPTGNATLVASNLQERTEAIRRLDELFIALGRPEDDLLRSPQLQAAEVYANANGAGPNLAPPASGSRTKSPDIWNPVNNNNSSLNADGPFNPSTGPPQHYPQLYPQQPSNTSTAMGPSQNPSNTVAYNSNSGLPSVSSNPASNQKNDTAGLSSTYTSTDPAASSSSQTPAALTYHWSLMQQALTGEDVAAFVDGRSEAEWAAMKANWDLVKEDTMIVGGATGTNVLEPRLWGPSSIRPGWYGILWGWI